MYRKMNYCDTRKLILYIQPPFSAYMIQLPGIPSPPFERALNLFHIYFVFVCTCIISSFEGHGNTYELVRMAYCTYK
jgi:hypothetical protein